MSGTNTISTMGIEERIQQFVKGFDAKVKAHGVSSADRVGLEWEGHFVSTGPDRHVRHIAEQVIPSIDDPFLCAEQGRNQFEFNFPPVPAAGGFRGVWQEHLRVRTRMLNAAAAPLGGTALFAAVPPTLRGGDLRHENAYPSPRAASLNEQFQEAKRRYRERFGTVLTVDGVYPQDEQTFGAISSMQIHHELPCDPVAAAHEVNLTTLVTPLALALSTGSPFFLSGESEFAEFRIPIWDVADMGRGRVFYAPGWVRSPIEMMQRVASVPFWDMGLDYGSMSDDELWTRHTKSVWTHLRLCIGEDHWRLENRVFPSVTPEEGELTIILYLALLRGLVADRSYRGFHEEMDFAVTLRNFEEAAKFGTAARLRWVDGREYSPGGLLMHLWEPLIQGLHSMGLGDDQELRERLFDRVRHGSPGDRIRNQVFRLRQRGHSRLEAGAFVTTDLLRQQARYLG